MEERRQSQSESTVEDNQHRSMSWRSRKRSLGIGQGITGILARLLDLILVIQNLVNQGCWFFGNSRGGGKEFECHKEVDANVFGDTYSKQRFNVLHSYLSQSPGSTDSKGEDILHWRYRELH
ncbi:hypothetical protein QJS10_CPB18g00854 [Acorus calamus]|uniref:Uncharacterized protein n=1 Tax=Acorus calamus TaxID=4465 RepID=A0AAV9CSD6_ACOCL|nr:hypothetical protein QJS10_CPB18g00854 [Acorus calamus]